MYGGFPHSTAIEVASYALSPSTSISTFCGINAPADMHLLQIKEMHSCSINAPDDMHLLQIKEMHSCSINATADMHLLQIKEMHSLYIYIRVSDGIMKETKTPTLRSITFPKKCISKCV